MPAKALSLDKVLESSIITMNPHGGLGFLLPNVRRDGRVAEGTRLLSEWVVNTASRVQIPVSPPFCF